MCDVALTKSHSINDISYIRELPVLNPYTTQEKFLIRGGREWLEYFILSLDISVGITIARKSD